MDVEGVRLAVYTGFAREGRPPTVDELAHRFERSAEAVGDDLEQLAGGGLAVVDLASAERNLLGSVTSCR